MHIKALQGPLDVWKQILQTKNMYKLQSMQAGLAVNSVQTLWYKTAKSSDWRSIKD